LSSATQISSITIRPLDRREDLRDVEALQKEVWGCADLDVVPLTMLVASREVGAVLIGAFDQSKLAGFVYGFPGYEDGRATHHSHMLAVNPAYRNHDLGYKLKVAQCESVLAQGINSITWTFDPLQSLNAHFNFAKLGVIADSYKINFYGEATSSFLHQIGTDRLWVTWLLDSQRVRERLHSEKKRSKVPYEAVPTLVQVGPSYAPQKSRSDDIRDHLVLSIEIPGDINLLQRQNPALAIEWRLATREAFIEGMALGYRVEEFYRSVKQDQPIGIYLLNRST